MSENKIESVDGFDSHLQHLGNIINYLDGLQMGEVGKFDKGEGQVLTKASDNDFDTYWQDLAFTKKSYSGVIAPNAYKEINTGIPTRNIIVDVKVKDTTSDSETSGFYINAQNLSTVAITDNKIRIFNEYSTNLEFLITTMVLNDSEIIAI